MNKNLKGLIYISICALLAALSIILGKYLAINITQSFRISFENLPILIAAIYLGPIPAAAVATVADLVGCILVGYAINPLITLGAAAVGLCGGIAAKWAKEHAAAKAVFAVLAGHLIGSVVLKTLGIVIFYGSPFFATLLLRAGIYLITAVAEAGVLYFLGKNKAFTKELEKITAKEKK